MPQSHSPSLASKLCLRSLRVLVVDDEPMMLRALRRLLKRSRPEWELSLVASGEDALELLDEKEFDAIVTDLRMVGMQGRTLLEKVRERYPDLARIIHSAHMHALPGDADTIAHFRVEKPASVEMLIDAIEQSLANARASDSENRSA